MTGRRRAALAVSAVAGVAMLAGCNGSFQGGGTMAGAHGGQAQIQFKVLCNTRTQKVSGQLLYTDPSAKLFLLGAPSAYPSGTFDGYDATCDNDTSNGDYLGSYVSLSPRGSGQFELTLSADSSCSATGFSAEVYLTSGPAAGYDNSKCLASGSVKPITD